MFVLPLEMQEPEDMVPCVHEGFGGQVCGFLCQFAALFLPALKRVCRFFQCDWRVFACSVNQAREAKIHQIALCHRDTTFQGVSLGLTPQG